MLGSNSGVGNGRLEVAVILAVKTAGDEQSRNTTHTMRIVVVRVTFLDASFEGTNEQERVDAIVIVDAANRLVSDAR